MKKIYTESRKGNRGHKKINFNRYETMPVALRRQIGLFGRDWAEFNEKHGLTSRPEDFFKMPEDEQNITPDYKPVTETTNNE